MKIHGTSSTQSQPSKSLKKGKADGTFQSMLEAGIDAVDANTTSDQHDGKETMQRWQLVEDAANLLDQALEQLSSGEKPAEELLNTIQQLRSELHQNRGETTKELNQADTLLAIEAERIHSLGTINTHSDRNA